MSTRASRAYQVNADGTPVNVILDGVTLTNVRPGERVEMLLGSTARKREYYPPPIAAVVEASPLDRVPHPTVSTADALRELEGLRSAGLISDAEYAAKRAAILARL